MLDILVGVHHEILIFAAVGLAVGGMDDLLIGILVLRGAGYAARQ